MTTSSGFAMLCLAGTSCDRYKSSSVNTISLPAALFSRSREIPVEGPSPISGAAGSPTYQTLWSFPSQLECLQQPESADFKLKALALATRFPLLALFLLACRY